MSGNFAHKHINMKGEKMKLSKTLKKVIRAEGKQSISAKKIIALRSSKEFNYLVDINKA